MRTSLTISCLMLCCSCANSNVQAQVSALDACPRPTIGSMVPEPEDLRSRDGVLTVNLTVRNQKQKDGSTRYCYTYGNGIESPNLRLKPGDLLILKLKNDLIDLEQARPERAGPGPSAARHNGKNNTVSKSDPCSGGEMNATSANIHFHGLTIPSVCHQDEVLKTSVRPSDPPFVYRVRIPAHSRLQQSTSSRRSLRRFNRRGNRTSKQRSRRITRTSSDHPRSGFAEPQFPTFKIRACCTEDVDRPRRRRRK